MNWKAFFAVVMVFLVIYGVYYLLTQVELVKLLTIPRLFQPFPRSTSTPRTEVSRGTSRTATPPANPPRTSAVSAPGVRTPTPPSGFTVADLSPYYDKVQMISVRPPDRYGMGGEFTLRVDTSASAPVDVTGWTIRTNRRGSLIISGAGAATGPVNRARILVRPGTSATFYAAWSSSVKNVELNACTGYLNYRYIVSPKFPTNCPRPSRSEMIGFSGACQNFINSLSPCEIPTPTEINQFAVSGDAACRAFIDTLTYEGCVRRYESLPNFYSYGWRVWLGTELRFDPFHDRLLLFDASGKLVDEYVY